ncbi:MAG: tetratricopeptide repeat protein [Nitrospirota bacterium]
MEERRKKIKPAHQKQRDMLNKGIYLHQTGRLQEAEEIYRQILNHNPLHEDAMHLLGVIAYQSGSNDMAAELIGKAILINPSIPNFHNNLGNALKSQGKIDEAIQSFKEAIRLKPDYPEAYLNLGNAFKEKGKLDDAIEYYKKTISIKPDFADGYNNLGNLLKEQGKLDDAIEYYKKAISIKPDFAEAFHNLGNLFEKRKNFDEAIEYYKKAISVKPDFARAYNNLGNLLKKQGRVDKAVEYYQKAVELNPDFAEAYYNLANAPEDQGKLDGVVEYYKKAIGVKPGFAEAHFNRGIALLLMGNFEEGWAEYEWRFRTEEIARQIGYNDFGIPRWDGSALNSKTILISSEQGFGDTIQFIRYMPLVKEKGGKVIFESPKEVRQLIEGFHGIDQIVEWPVSKNRDIKFDTYIPLLSLPGIFRTTVDTIIAEVPYLRANPELVKKWHKEIHCKELKVGLVWAGNPVHKNDHNRSCKLSDFRPIGFIHGIKLFSLQKGTPADQLSESPENMSIVNIGEQLMDFSDTAAVIQNLDMVISVDTAIVHLAGALGKPVWTLLPFMPDWRWMQNREDSPWYPTMRLFRQPEAGDWKSVIANIREELKRLVNKGSN